MKEETQNALAIERGALGAIVDFQLQFEKALTALKIRNTHLTKNGTIDPETVKLLEESELFKKEFILKPVKKLLVAHPAYPWFSRVKGIGNENIAKVVSLINIRKPETPSALWKYAGYGVDENGKADRPKKGELLHFNKTLKTMCYRLGVSLLKAHGLSKTGTKFGDYYEKEYAKELSRAERLGLKIAHLIKDIPEGKEGQYMTSLYVHNRAFRKMVKLFLECLWLYWREAEGLPIRDPYVKEKMGHTSIILPKDMMDR